MQIVISGASGLIGSALSSHLRARGDRVVELVRREAQGTDESRWDPATGLLDTDVITSADAVVNLAGASIGDKRLTKSYKKVVLQSRLDSTDLIANAVAQNPKVTLIQGSAMGYYGDRGEEPLTEDLPPGDTFLSQIVTQWEAAAAPAVHAGARVAYNRTGLVLTSRGGFAERLLPMTARGIMGGLGPRDAIRSWISLPDVVRALTHLIDSPAMVGPVNVIAPQAVTDVEFFDAFAEVFGRGPGLRVPGWAMRLGVGDAAVDLLTSQNGIPKALLDSGFVWEHPHIRDAAAYVVGGMSQD